MHIDAETDIDIILPDPSSMGLISGTQFYIYNLSSSKVILKPSAGIELHARSNTLLESTMTQ